MLVPVKNLGQLGVVVDTPSHMLPANAWTNARGIRFYDNSVWKAEGISAVLGVPSLDPYFIYEHIGPSSNLWIYFGKQKAIATDGTTHTEVTRVSGDYNATSDDFWQGTHLGGIEIFNNGIDTPQAWINPSLGTPLIDLANWPPGTTADVIRSFKQYLIAFNVNKPGGQFPFLVKWSHVADPGTVPSSWDETNATLDAGEYPLAETGGKLVDAQRLGNKMIVYKEDETWVMTYVGGRFIFKFEKLFDFGMLTQHCVVTYKKKHYVATREDIIVHDGFQEESLLDDRKRRWYQSTINSANAFRQFMVLNEKENELWMCMPTGGSNFATIALIINLKDGTSTFSDLPNVAYITSAPYEGPAADETFDVQNVTFDEFQGRFGETTNPLGSSRLIGVVPDPKEILLFDDNFVTRDTGGSVGYVERLGMPIAGLSREGLPVMDSSKIKQVNEIWPEINMTNGTSVDIYIGGQDILNEPIDWEGPLTFLPGVDEKVDCNTSGRYISIRYYTEGAELWQLDTYSLNIEIMGQF